jgi:hypothetical protein
MALNREDLHPLKRSRQFVVALRWDRMSETWKLPVSADEMPVLGPGSKSRPDWEPEEVRVTVPLFNTLFVENDDPVDGRIDVASNTVIGKLNQSESERVKTALQEDWDPEYRLEIHHHPVALEKYRDYPTHTEEAVRRAFALMCCVIRATPRWPTIVLDYYHQGQWRRFDWVPRAGGGFPFGQHGAWTIKMERVRAWGDLIAHFPPLGSFPSLDLTLDYFYDSVVDRKAHPHKAFYLASTAHEILLGPRNQKMIRKTLTERGATLAGAPHQRDLLTFSINEWYRQRSELVHEGERPAEEDVVRIHQYLMRAIPSMAALAIHHDHYAAALDALDEAAGGNTSALPPDFYEPQQWWSRVDVLAAFERQAF